jgi:outer membrane protein assembly factor BamB
MSRGSRTTPGAHSRQPCPRTVRARPRRRHARPAHHPARPAHHPAVQAAYSGGVAAYRWESAWEWTSTNRWVVIRRSTAVASPPAVAGDIVYASSVVEAVDGRLAALTVRGGHELWRLDPQAKILGPAPAVAVGTVYIAAWNGLYALE